MFQKKQGYVKRKLTARAEACLGHVVFLFHRRRGRRLRPRAAVPVAAGASAAVAVAVAEASAAPAGPSPAVFGALGHAGIERLIQIDRREVDAALTVHLDDANRDLIAEFDRLFGTAYRRDAQVADVNQSLFARNDLHKGAHADQPGDLAGVDLSDLDLRHHAENGGGGPFSGLLVHRRDEDAAILLDIDLRAGVGGDLLDGLAARADHLADALRVDLDGEDGRRESAQAFAWSGHGLIDFAQNVQPAQARLLQRFDHHLVRQPLDLAIELNGRDAIGGSGHFEIHVAGEVLHALNVA